MASELIRYEFLEILVRLAKVKFVDTGKEKNYYEALTLLFDQISKEYPLIGYNKWRKTSFWNHGISALFDSNKDNIKKVYDHFTKPGKTKLLLADVQDWLCGDKVPEGCCISERDCRAIFAMSKMPVLDEEKMMDKYT